MSAVETMTDLIYFAPSRWDRKDYISFFLITLFLFLHLAIARYPFIDWDSGAYLAGSIKLTTDFKDLTLLSNLLFPLAKLTGAWAFPIFQIILLSYTLVSFLKFFDTGFMAAVIAITISGVWFVAIKVMMDIYTVTGILVLFLIVNGKRDIVLYSILGLCYIAHYENLVLFPFCGMVYWIIFERKNFRFIVLPILMVFILGVSSIILIHFSKEGRPRLFPKIKNLMLAAPIMVDSEQIVRSYMEKYPDSVISKQKAFYKNVINLNSSGLRVQTLLWDSKNGLATQPEKDLYIINRDAGRFLSYAFTNYKFILIKNTVKDTFLFLVKPGFDDGWEYSSQPVDRYIKTIIPGQFPWAQHSLQYKARSSVFLIELFYLISFCLTFPIVIFYALTPIIRRHIENSTLYSFIIFVIIVMLMNACLSNFSGIFLRLQFRVLLLPVLGAVLVIMESSKKFFPRGFLLRTPEQVR